ncbi:MAG: diaminopimelate epimerase [Gemmatimonadetes bacterium]|nr:MAG: diaminopimelate epimerase [Gemmatimonadota bacterium]
MAAWLARTGRVGVEPFEVEVGGDRVTMQVHARGADGVYDVSVRMGRARVGAEAVGLALDAPGVRAGEPPTVTIALGAAGTVAVLPVSVGNPHAVVFDEPLERARLEAVGSSLAVHAAFAHGTNVQLARVRAPGQLEARVWERGVGWTAASGTSACAVAVAAVSSGRASPGEHRVHMEGGVLRVSVDEALEVTLRGPVQEVCEGELAEGFLAGLAGD